MNQNLCLTYSVSESQYQAVIAREMRHTARRPLRLFVTLLLTLGQTALAVYLCVTSAFSTGQKAGILALSLVVSIIQVLRFSMFKRKARYTLTQLRESGELPEAYFSPHTLCLEGSLLKVTYGEGGFTAELGLISSVCLYEDMYLIFAGKKMLEIVPASALPEGYTSTLLLSDIRPDAVIRAKANGACVRRISPKNA